MFELMQRSQMCNVYHSADYFDQSNIEFVGFDKEGKIVNGVRMVHGKEKTFQVIELLKFNLVLGRFDVAKSIHVSCQADIAANFYPTYAFAMDRKSTTLAFTRCLLDDRGSSYSGYIGLVSLESGELQGSACRKFRMEIGENSGRLDYNMSPPLDYCCSWLAYLHPHGWISRAMNGYNKMLFFRYSFQNICDEEVVLEKFTELFFENVYFSCISVAGDGKIFVANCEFTRICIFDAIGDCWSTVDIGLTVQQEQALNNSIGHCLFQVDKELYRACVDSELYVLKDNVWTPSGLRFPLCLIPPGDCRHATIKPIDSSFASMILIHGVSPAKKCGMLYQFRTKLPSLQDLAMRCLSEVYRFDQWPKEKYVDSYLSSFFSHSIRQTYMGPDWMSSNGKFNSIVLDLA